MECIIWKRIADYPDYWIGDNGLVMSLKQRRAKIKVGYPSRHGHLQMALYKDGAGKVVRIHRMVANLFVPNHNDLPDVTHLNKDRTDNRARNLAWISHSGSLTREKQAKKKGAEKLPVY